MRVSVVEESGRSPRRGLLARWLLKTLLFIALTLVVLNPNLKRAFLQVCHTLDPEKLIQPQSPALAEINPLVDQFVAANRTRHSEARLIAKFVLREIQYVSDYDNWGNVEYWPTPQEVWNKRQEDCDGRAILASTILRSRGYRSASLVVGLDHMWIIVDENEKDPSRPMQLVTLLNPKGDFSIELRDSPGTSDLLRVVKAVLHPTALRETSSHLFAGMPPLRKAVLIIALLLLCLHPCKHRTALLAVTAAGMVAVMLLADWQPGDGRLLSPVFGAVVLLAALGAALLMERVIKKPVGPPPC